MTAGAQHILTAFDALPAAEREAVMAALLTRSPAGAGELSDAALVELVDDLFRSYDAAEMADAPPPADRGGGVADRPRHDRQGQALHGAQRGTRDC